MCMYLCIIYSLERTVHEGHIYDVGPLLIYLVCVRVHFHFDF